MNKVIEVMSTKWFIYLICILLGIALLRTTFTCTSPGNEFIVEEPKAILDLSSDKNFLTCNRKQLECYYKNLGLKKETILYACKDITYCDGAK